MNSRHRWAWRESAGWRKIKVEVAATVISGIGLGISQAVQGEGAFDAVLTGVVGAAAIAFLLPAFGYIWHFIRAPARMLREKTAEVDDLKANVNDLEAELARRCGTLIPPGWNAIVTGTQQGEGEWVPPGYTVRMGQGPLSDELGNTIGGGSDSRIYGGHGNTTMGSGSKVGRPEWCR